MEQEIEQDESKTAPEHDQCKRPKAAHDSKKQNSQQQKYTRFNHLFSSQEGSLWHHNGQLADRKAISRAARETCGRR